MCFTAAPGHGENLHSSWKVLQKAIKTIFGDALNMLSNSVWQQMHSKVCNPYNTSQQKSNKNIARERVEATKLREGCAREAKIAVLDESGECGRHKVPIFASDSARGQRCDAEMELKFALSMGRKMLGFYMENRGF